jgi:hypothetical protein
MHFRAVVCFGVAFMSDCVPLPAMPYSGTVDSRQTERIYCERLVQLRTSDKREFAATCTDVNRSGIGVECERVLAVGQRVELLLARDQRVPMLVMYRMGQHYGLSALGSFEAMLELLPRH